MRTQAIIIKKIAIREYDELIICYTKNFGKQTYQAKSVLRPTSKQAAHLDTFNLADFSLVTGNGSPIITSAESLKTFPGLKANLSALTAGYFLLECFDKLIFENEPDQKLWDFLIAELEKYDQLGTESDIDWSQIIAISRKKLLRILGYDPETEIESLTSQRFKSLQLVRKVIG